MEKREIQPPTSKSQHKIRNNFVKPTHKGEKGKYPEPTFYSGL